MSVNKDGKIVFKEEEKVICWFIPPVSYFFKNLRKRLCSPDPFESVIYFTRFMLDSRLDMLDYVRPELNVSEGSVGLHLECDKNECENNQCKFIRVGVINPCGEEIAKNDAESELKGVFYQENFHFRTPRLVEEKEVKLHEKDFESFRLYCDIEATENKLLEGAGVRTIKKNECSSTSKSLLKETITATGKILLLGSHIYWTIPSLCYLLENAGNRIWSPTFDFLSKDFFEHYGYIPDYAFSLSPGLKIPTGWLGLTIEIENPFGCIQVGMMDNKGSIISRSTVQFPKKSFFDDDSNFYLQTPTLAEEQQIEKGKRKYGNDLRVFCELKHGQHCPFVEKDRLRQAIQQTSLQRKIGCFLDVASGSGVVRKQRKSKRK